MGCRAISASGGERSKEGPTSWGFEGQILYFEVSLGGVMLRACFLLCAQDSHQPGEVQEGFGVYMGTGDRAPVRPS